MHEGLHEQRLAVSRDMGLLPRWAPVGPAHLTGLSGAFKPADAGAWDSLHPMLLAIVLAFSFGCALTMRPLLAAGIPTRRAPGLALAADTISIAIMEVVDNGFMLLVPGAMDAPLTSGLFWGALGVALLLASAAAFPANL